MNHHSENVDWFNSIKPSKKQVVPEVVRKSLEEVEHNLLLTVEKSRKLYKAKIMNYRPT